MANKRGNNEGSVYQRRDRRWVACITLGYANGGRRRKTLLADSKREAKKKLAQLLQAQEQGLALDADPTVADYLRKWLKETAIPSLRPRTGAGYASIVHQHLVPSLGRIKLRKLSVADVEIHLRRTAASGLSGGTIKYHHAVLGRALKDAERWGLVSRNVARLVTPPRVQRRDVQPLTPEQARLFLASVEDDRLRALYMVSISLGLRQGEALALAWTDIDFEARTLRVSYTLQRYNGTYHLDAPKTERSQRTVTLPPQIIDALYRHRATQNEERLQFGKFWAEDRRPFVFCDELGEPLNGRTVTRVFRKKLADLGLPAQRFHDLRHAAATFLIAQGIPLRVIMEILGHSTIATTADIYGHVELELQRDATERAATALYGT